MNLQVMGLCILMVIQSQENYCKTYIFPFKIYAELHFLILMIKYGLFLQVHQNLVQFRCDSLWVLGE